MLLSPTISRKAIKTVSVDRGTEAVRLSFLHSEDEDCAEHEEAGRERKDGAIGGLRAQAQRGTAADHQASDQRSEHSRQVAGDAPDAQVLAGGTEHREAIDR